MRCHVSDLRAASSIGDDEGGTRRDHKITAAGVMYVSQTMNKVLDHRGAGAWRHRYIWESEINRLLPFDQACGDRRRHDFEVRKMIISRSCCGVERADGSSSGARKPSTALTCFQESSRAHFPAAAAHRPARLRFAVCAASAPRLSFAGARWRSLNTSQRLPPRERRARWIAIAANVRESEQVATLLERVACGIGRLDCVINNAGGQFPGNAIDFPGQGLGPR